MTELKKMPKKGDFVIVKGVDKSNYKAVSSKASSKTNMWLSFGYIQNAPTQKPLQHCDPFSVSCYSSLFKQRGEGQYRHPPIIIFFK